MTQYLFPQEVEKAFVQVAIDLKAVIALDGIDILSDPAGLRIRCHDLFGPLPEIMITDTGDRYPLLDATQREAAKTHAIANIRRDLAVSIPVMRQNGWLDNAYGSGSIYQLQIS